MVHRLRRPEPRAPGISPSFRPVAGRAPLPTARWGAAGPAFGIAPPASQAPIQRVFRVPGRSFTRAGDVEDVRQKIIDNIPRRRQYEVNPKTLVLYLKGWAGKKKDYGYFASYKRLVTVALDMRVREAAASLPAVSSTSLKTGLPKGYDRKKTPLSVKLKTMRRLRRAASPYTRKEKEVADFRDTSKMATLSSKEHTASFSIGHTGNFLLGLMQEHDYKDFCAKAKSTLGLDDAQVAVRLLNHLQGLGTARASVDNCGQRWQIGKPRWGRWP